MSGIRGIVRWIGISRSILSRSKSGYVISSNIGERFKATRVHAASSETQVALA